MIAYFDTSALVPLLIEEPASKNARRIWGQADRVASIVLSYPEARAAIGRAHRAHRIDGETHRLLAQRIEELLEDVDLVALTRDLGRWAGELADRYSLGGADALHLAAGSLLADPELVLVAGDQALCAAARRLGLAVAELA